ncbi:hypothetical protein [Nitratireductor sp. ZSWI3]|uniref:hypothetical protein n=1 Tax=Nitratireductor sp. ZSWI3 TaxID=2966359 RepID=UPI0021501A73|nr:hypothetical protein [Nitratireductor sp. ZSWI3]MCR4267068.1 hypothetical protein [Nitratireductor sp. ZSWI3]
MPLKTTPKKARQGRRGLPVLLVLVFGLLLAAVVWWGVEVYGLMLDNQQTVETQASRDTPGG